MSLATPRARLIHLLWKGVAILAVGLLYALFVTTTGLSIPCVIRLVTGLRCPGCGMTGMCLHLLRLDFAGAWHSNPAVMALLPLGGAVAVDMSVRYVRSGATQFSRFSNAAMIFMLVVLLVFGILRNILSF